MDQVHRNILAATQVIRDVGFDSRLKAHVGAIITKGGSIISIATNTWGINQYSLRNSNNQHLQTTHAEVNAILRVRHKIDLDGAKMWVGRLTKPLQDSRHKNRKYDSYIALAEPCPDCKNIISKHGIKRVYYSIDEETWACWRVPKIYIPRKKLP